MRSDVTVGIPFYKKTSCKDLMLSVNSIINQTLKADMIHLIQDGDVDGQIEQVVKKYVLENHNIQHIKLKKGNLAISLNESIKRTKTKYYARMDADDISNLNRLKVQCEFLDHNNHIDILGSWAIEFKNNINSKDNFIKEVPSNSVDIITFYHYRNPLVHPSVVFRVKVFDIVGYYNEKFSSDQDLELWGRCIKCNIGISNIEKPLLYNNISGIHIRRTRLRSIYNQILARSIVPAPNLKLKLLKTLSIFFRFMPKLIIKYAYRRLR